jgi:hypothetical protein
MVGGRRLLTFGNGVAAHQILYAEVDAAFLVGLAAYKDASPHLTHPKRISTVGAYVLSHAVVVNLTGNCALFLRTADRTIEACVKKTFSICCATHFHTVSVLAGEHEWALFVVHAGRRRFLAHIVDALITLEDAVFVPLALNALIIHAVRGEK